ncbi:MAG TPA: Clp protease N-terminal domain-containing protein [Verrucomicrobiae bacterium]|jgi:ATP-dependent Clp protease ATP-binding subunit ClpC|nr:Clp protease N-terminal domain-containing protein [Verrucomicrobiae bacterium]
MNWLKPFRKGAGESTVVPPSNFTPRAQRVLALAQGEAERLKHNFIGTEHVLLGLISLGAGVAFDLFDKMGVDPEAVRNEVEKIVGVGLNRKETPAIPDTPRVKNVLAFAAEEAGAFGHTFVGTEHILLGLLREGDGVAGRVLKKFGLDIEKTREAVANQFGSKSPGYRAESLGPTLDL